MTIADRRDGSSSTAARPVAFNGIDGATGRPLFRSVGVEELARLARGEPREGRSFLQELRDWWRRLADFSFAPMEGIDPLNLTEAGWGLVTAHGSDPAVLEALRPLRELRQEQAGARYRELVGPDAYRPGESKIDFLARHDVGPGPVKPARMPYYLLLVGSPEEIPFHVQYQLDVQYAVGRICFDTVEEYARYARKVVAAETGRARVGRELAFFGVSKSGDLATQQSRRYLVEPLARELAEQAPDWRVRTSLGSEATKDRLIDLFTGRGSAPALIFTASHGLGFREAGHQRQRAEQGALVCHRSDGADEGAGDHFLTADDLPRKLGAAPFMAFNFACYSAGTPDRNSFVHRKGSERATVAPRPFVARLPQRLLAEPAGGALAVIGHVDRAWGYSFLWRRTGEQTEVFSSTLRRLLRGCPVGHALEFFDQRYAELATELARLREDEEYGAVLEPRTLSGLWTANNDARNYVLLGDPATRLPADPEAL